MDEAGLLKAMRAALSGAGAPEPPPWNDDAAILTGEWLAPDTELVITQDMLVEDVDFRLRYATLADVGFKAIEVNQSDLAGKGAVPRYGFVSVACRAAQASEMLSGLYTGMGEACALSQLSIAGGDLSATSGPLTLDVTLIGTAPRGGSWRRTSARVGDTLWVSRELGLARLGLLSLERDHTPAGFEAELDWLRQKQLRPSAELVVAKRLRELGYAGACMDVSDGLARDLPRLCDASGVGALIDAEAVELRGGFADIARALGEDPLLCAVLGGEDFALLGAVRDLPALFDLRAIGRVVDASQGIQLQMPDGTLAPWPSGGFDHFARRSGDG